MQDKTDEEFVCGLFEVYLVTYTNLYMNMCVCVCVKSCHLKLEYKLLSCILHTFFSNMRDHLEPVRFFATFHASQSI